jgi:hypothetical protein
MLGVNVELLKNDAVEELKFKFVELASFHHWILD